MQRKDNTIQLNSFKNYYCDALSCALGKYLNVFEINEENLLKETTDLELETLIELSVLKNVVAGVGQLNIKVSKPGLGIKYLDKYNLKGKEVISARLLPALSTSDFVGGRIGFDVENLLDYAEGFLVELSDFTGQLEIPVYISLGRDIEEVGKLVNRYKLSPAEVLESFGFLDRQCFVYGLNYIDKEDQKLLKTYDCSLIFTPRSDGEEGKGAINLYNFIYNDLSFCFSSGKCYNINMLGEGKLALLNTSNLMHESGLIKPELLLNSLEGEYGQIELEFEKEERLENLFDQKVTIQNEQLLKRLEELEKQTKQIAKRLKEKF